MPAPPFWVNQSGNTISFLNRMDSEFPIGIPLSEFNLSDQSFSEFLFATGGTNNGQMSATQHLWTNRTNFSATKSLHWYYPQSLAPQEFFTNQQANNSTNFRFSVTDFRTYPSDKAVTRLYSGHTSSGMSLVSLTPSEFDFDYGELYDNDWGVGSHTSSSIFGRGFQFGVHTPGTFSGFWYTVNNNPSNSLHESWRECAFRVTGWLRKSPFSTTSGNERYQSLFSLGAYWFNNPYRNIRLFNLIPTSLGVYPYTSAQRNSVFLMNGGNASNNVFMVNIGYKYDYEMDRITSNRFHLHEIQLIIGNNGTQISGYVDSTVAILGRGDFEQMKIYKFTNIFGRTGDEYWMCLGYYTPLIVRPEPTNGRPHRNITLTNPPILIGNNVNNYDLFRYPDPESLDFILVRINYTP